MSRPIEDSEKPAKSLVHMGRWTVDASQRPAGWREMGIQEPRIDCGMDPERERIANLRIRDDAEPSVPRGSKWGSTVASIAVLRVGQSINIEVPDSDTLQHFKVRLRNTLAAAPSTKSGKFSVLEDDGEVVVTRKNGTPSAPEEIVVILKSPPKPAAKPPEPIEEIEELDPVAAIAGDDSPDVPRLLDLALLAVTDPEYDLAEIVSLAETIRLWREAKVQVDAILIDWMAQHQAAADAAGIEALRKLWGSVHSLVQERLMLERKVARLKEVLES